MKRFCLLLFALTLLLTPFLWAVPYLTDEEAYIKEKIAGFDEEDYQKISRNKFMILEEMGFYKRQLRDFEKGISKNPHLKDIAKSRMEMLTKSLKEEEEKLERVEQKLKGKRDSLKKKLYQRKKTAILHLQKASQSSPGFQPVKHLLLTHPSASEFNGALEWAHRKGIIGEHTSVLVLEDPGNFLHSDLEWQLEGEAPYSAHGVSVAGLVYEMAPGARISVYAFEHPEIYDPVPDNTIINNSSDGSDKVDAQVNELDKKLLVEKNNLLVISAGNGGKYFKKEGVEDPLDFLFTQVHPSPKKRIIIAGALDPSSRISSFANKPGSRKEFQERFLCALGKNVLVRQQESGYGIESGASFATPAISGAAALILGEYHDFTMEEVAAVLLESAEKNFYISSANKMVYDPFDSDQKEAIEAKYGPKNREYFNPKNYGKGVLSIRRALMYAEIYARVKAENPQQSLEENIAKVTPLFKDRIRVLNHLHATNIQKTFRGWKIRKESKEGRVSR